MAGLKDLWKPAVAVAAAGVGIWLRFKLDMLFDEQGWPAMRRRPEKVEIQTLFHGNTKDQDQI